MTDDHTQDQPKQCTHERLVTMGASRRLFVTHLQAIKILDIMGDAAQAPRDDFPVVVIAYRGLDGKWVQNNLWHAAPLPDAQND